MARSREERDLLKLAMENDDDDLVYFLITKKPDSTFINFKRFDINNLTNAQCVNNFRFDKKMLFQLAYALNLPEKFVCPNRAVISKIDGLCMLLRRMAYPNRLSDLEQFFGRPKSVLSFAIAETLDYIYERHGNLIQNLDQPWFNNRLQNFADKIHAKGAPLTNCIGFIDGTVRPICRPSMHQRVCFNGHKRVHSIKFQSIVSPDGMICHLYGPMEGRRHDCALLRESRIMDYFERVLQRDRDGLPYCIYGDPAYPVRDYILSPFKEAQLSPEQELFNKHMSSVRQCVEWQFGKIITNFAFLDFKKNLKIFLQPVAKYYIVGALLTNCHTCLYCSQTSDYFNLAPPTLEEYLQG